MDCVIVVKILIHFIDEKQFHRKPADLYLQFSLEGVEKLKKHDQEMP